MNKPAKAKPARRAREDRDLVEKLERQLGLLRKFSESAFQRLEPAYFPEVANKLRLLLVKSRMNTPLLFAAADRFNVELKVIVPPGAVSRPESEGEMTLDHFFDLIAYRHRKPDGTLGTATKRELIRAWCEQEGGAHLDWEVEEWLVQALRPVPIRLNGLEPSQIVLRNCANAALQHGASVVEAGYRRLKVE